MKITLNYDYLRYDVEQLITKYSYARIEDAEKRYKADLRSENTHDGDLIRRMVVSAAGRLRQTMASYLALDTADANSNLSAEQTAFTYRLKESVYADSNSLAVVMHQLVVKYAISAWCAMQGLYGDADQEIAKADRYEADLKSGIFRSKPARPCETSSSMMDEMLN